MRYNKSVCLLMGVIVVFFALPSCNKYLDVQPENLFLEPDVYNSASSVRNALNGIYLNLAKPAAYGENYTCTTMDVLAQYYQCNTYDNNFMNVAAYDFADATVANYTSEMWRSSYAAVLNLNLFIKNITTGNKILPEADQKLMLGEAYGLRAFLLFDLLRLFGPVYATDSLETAIPYPLDPAPKIQPLLPANVIMVNVLQDLGRADSLLEKDPVRTVGVKAAASAGDAYFSIRNRRMNYYAVRALTARVLLYQGNRIAAKAVANTVIAEASSKFPWSPAENSAIGTDYADRMFSPEVLFGLENADMYNTQKNWFNAKIKADETILKPDPDRLEEIYEQYGNDYRYRINFAVDRTASRTDKTFFKFDDIGDQRKPYRNFQSLIRLSELYYISAECEPDDNVAAALLNTVRFNRGLPPLILNGDKQEQIAREYRKEFWGEGQLFFYYKRMMMTSIADGSSNEGSISMPPGNYVVPLPLNETPFR